MRSIGHFVWKNVGRGTQYWCIRGSVQRAGKLQSPNVKGYVMRKILIIAVAIVVLWPLAVSFEAQQPSQAKVFEHAGLGLSLNYPAAFIEQDTTSAAALGLPEQLQMLFVAASAQQLPSVSVFQLPTPEGVSVDAFGEQVAIAIAQMVGVGEAKIESAKETTLQDDVTEAMEFVVAMSAGGFELKNLSLFVPRGPQTVLVSVIWADAMGDRATQKVDDIAYSLKFE